MSFGGNNYLQPSQQVRLQPSRGGRGRARVGIASGSRRCNRCGEFGHSPAECGDVFAERRNWRSRGGSTFGGFGGGRGGGFGSGNNDNSNGGGGFGEPAGGGFDLSNIARSFGGSGFGEGAAGPSVGFGGGSNSNELGNSSNVNKEICSNCFETGHCFSQCNLSSQTEQQKAAKRLKIAFRKPGEDPLDDQERNFPVIVEGKRLYVSKMALAGCSPVFRKILFNPNFADSSKEDLTLPEKKFDDMNEFFACLFCTFEFYGQKKAIDFDNFATLTALADQYDVQDMFALCRNFVQGLLADKSSAEKLDLAKLASTQVLQSCLAYKCLNSLGFDLIKFMATKPSSGLWEQLEDVPVQIMAAIFEAKLSRAKAENAEHSLKYNEARFGYSHKECKFCGVSKYLEVYNCKNCQLGVCKNCYRQGTLANIGCVDHMKTCYLSQSNGAASDDTKMRICFCHYDFNGDNVFSEFSNVALCGSTAPRKDRRKEEVVPFPSGPCPPEPMPVTYEWE